jgi:hypothetical protein
VLPFTWWLAGLPGCDAEAETETMQLMEKTIHEGAIPRWVSPVILFPGTRMYDSPEEFGIRTRIAGFAGFSRFSEVSLAEALHFPELVTHVRNGEPEDASLREAARYRTFLAARFQPLERRYAASDDARREVARARDVIRSSFL